LKDGLLADDVLQSPGAIILISPLPESDLALAVDYPGAVLDAVEE